MAITIDWGSKVITVPKADMTLIQASPEVRELDVDTFRLALKSLEDDADGMAHLDTHVHRTESTLSGIIYARFVEIINGYTVTFEDGTYGVSVTGGNTNLLDVKNPNQVSLLGNNSAGLIDLNPILAQLNYQGAVWVSASGVSGTIAGTHGVISNPVNSLADAYALATSAKLRTIRILDGSFTLPGDWVGRELWLGAGAMVNLGGYDVTDTSITGGGVTGTQGGSGEASYTSCHINGVSGLRGHVRHCHIEGTVSVGASGEAVLQACHAAGSPTLDMVGAGRTATVAQWSGPLTVTNMSDASNSVSIDFVSGRLTLAASCSAGDLTARGSYGPLVDSSTGTTVTTTGRTSLKDEVDAFRAYNGRVWIDLDSGSPGAVFGVNGTQSNPVDNLTDALTLTASVGVRVLDLVGVLTLDQDLENYEIIGSTAISGIVLNGYSIAHSIIRAIRVDGVFALTPPAIYYDCHLGVNYTCTNTRGFFFRTGFANRIEWYPGTQSRLIACHNIDDTGDVVFDMGGSTATICHLSDWTGKLEVQNMGDPFSRITGSMVGDELKIASTCTQGTVTLAGIFNVVDESGPSLTVDTSASVPDPLVREIWQLLGLDVGAQLVIDQPTATVAGSQTVGSIVLSVASENGGARMRVTRTA